MENVEHVEAVETLAELSVSDYEKERGKPMPSLNHGILQSKLVALLLAEKKFMVGSEITLDLSPRATPDIVIFNKRKIDWQHDEKRMTEMPITVIEILSGTQGLENFDEKLTRYFNAGIKSVWLVQPFIETIAIFLPNQKPKVFSSGELYDEATGIRLSVSEIFQEEF
ncbi:MAG: Uma2 family endonuclease [Chloroherpetonaceae bacterium]